MICLENMNKFSINQMLNEWVLNEKDDNVPKNDKVSKNNVPKR